jgi:GcrA cell cycle regulator
MTQALAKPKPGTQHSPATEAEVVRLYRIGLSREEIGAQAGVGRTTISAILNRNGVELRAPRSARNIEREAEVVRLYLADVSRAEITDKTGVPNSTITHILVRHGVERSKKQKAPVPSEISQAICKLFLEGLSYSQIAKELGITHGVVAGIVFRRKVKRPEEMSRANLKAAMRSRPRREPVRKPKLVAVASRDGERSFLVPEADAPKFVAREVAPQILTADEDPVLRLRALDCRWPIGNPGRVGFRFCCKIRIGSNPYCPEHERVAYRTPSKSEKDSCSIGRWA